jgi:uncharacterized protein YndB with AHSA1/START domain
LSITSVHTDHDRLTVTVIADFHAPIDQVWDLWSDPRKLERWWGPPDYPATFKQHDLLPGGEVTYFMTGPEGDQFGGMWQVTAVDPPTSLQFVASFADAEGTPIADMPVSRVKVRLTERESGTRMTMHSKFESREDLEKWLSTGTREGQQQAIGQIDVLLATADSEQARGGPNVT